MADICFHYCFSPARQLLVPVGIETQKARRHFQAIIFEQEFDNVFADVVYVAVHRRQHETSFGSRLFALLFLRLERDITFIYFAGERRPDQPVCRSQ